jgi:N-acetylglucosaminyl-diphospho-decaprenol L-rhamnosyltransferase
VISRADSVRRCPNQYELSIALVLYRSADTLTDCLRSIRPAVRSGYAEVIAVDNASPDHSASIVRLELPEAKLLARGDNQGFAVGMNTALAQAKGRYWMLLNPDVTVSVGALERLVGFMDAHPRMGVASPDLRSDDGRREFPGRAAPSIARTLLELSRLHLMLPRRIRGRILRGPYWTGGDQLAAGWVPATAAIVRPQAAREAGPLCESLFMYGEDLEWCWRIRQRGWNVGVCSIAELVHSTSSSARSAFGLSDLEKRIAAGMHGACRIMYGEWHARVLAALNALALWAEAVAPGRDAAYRRRVQLAASNWRRLASGR